MPTHSPDLSFRQTIEDMTLGFNPAVAGRLTAVVEFDARGAEPGVYHLSIADGECTFHFGPAAAPTLTIATPSEVWLKIRAGQLTGPEARGQGLYRATGDLSLLDRMGEVFRPPQGFTLKASDPYPPGPIRLSGLAWLQAAWVPWYLFWAFFGWHDRLLGVGLPLLLILILIAYRARYHETTLFEVGAAGFFALAAALTLAGVRVFDRTGSLVASLAVAMLWLGSLFTSMPLCGDYVKWGFLKPLWRHSRFIFPNAVIALVWGYGFVVAGLAGFAAAVHPEFHTALTVVRFGLIVPPLVFTIRYSQQAEQLRVPDFERAMIRLRLAAAVGLALSVALLEVVWIAL